MNNLLPGWKKSTLGAEGCLISRTPQYYSDYMPYIATADVQGFHVIPSEKVSFYNRPARAQLQIKKNDVLQAKMKDTNKAFFVTEEMDNWLASSGFALFMPQMAHNIPEFFYQYLNSEIFLMKKDALATGSTQQAINDKDLKSIPLILPSSMNEQNKIATILSTIDETIERTEALIEKYQHIKEGMMNDLFTRGVLPDGTLRPTRDEAPELYQETPIGWIPKEWSVVRVQELCSNIVDCPHSTPVYLKEGYPCIRTADMIPGRLLLDNVYKVDKKTYLDRTSRLVPKKGDIIYSREGERLGIASPICEDLVCLGQRVMMLRPSRETDPKYLMWAMNSSNFYRNVTSGTGATTSPHVNVGDIQRKNLPKPSLYEQKMIGLALHNIDQLLHEEEIGANKLQNQKSGLMHDLLTGKVRVKHNQE